MQLNIKKLNTELQELEQKIKSLLNQKNKLLSPIEKKEAQRNELKRLRERISELNDWKNPLDISEKIKQREKIKDGLKEKHKINLEEIPDKIKELTEDIIKITKEKEPEIKKLECVISATLSQRDSIFSEIEKEKEKEKEKREKERKEKPINLERWTSRWGNKKYKPAIWLARKKESRLLTQICEMHNLKLVERKNLTRYKATKLKKYRLTEYNFSFFLIPKN